MKTWSLTLIALSLTAMTGLAQQPGKKDFKPGNPEMMKAMQQMQREKTEMQLASYEAELEFDRRMRDLDIRERELELERMEKEIHAPDRHQAMIKRHKKIKECHDFIVLVIGLIHILMAIWVYKDIRKRNSGSGIWIIVTLLAGFFGVVPYAIIRLSDERR